MKVLWFTNSISCYQPIGSIKAHGYNGGGWISSAQKEICKHTEIELAVAFVLDKQPEKIKQNGVHYYPIPSPSHQSILSKLINKQQLLTTEVENYERNTWKYYLHHFKRIVEDFHPDIIHVWGSEQYFGLAWKVTDIPVILHVQGIINPIFNSYMPPNISWDEFIRATNTPLKYIKKKLYKKAWECSAYREKEIYKGIKAVLGRTEWDKRVTHCLNSEAIYYHVDEILRDEFYTQTKRIIPNKLTIISTISSPLYKGYDMILKTAKILKENLHLDFDWLCYGNIEPHFIEKITGIQHEEVNVQLCGIATSSQLREAEQHATLYFHPPYIDNSPNGLCEAQITGLPIISTNVGGIKSLVTDNEDGKLIPANDPYQAAYCIEELYFNTTYNEEYGQKAKLKAIDRHNKKKIINQILQVYKEIYEKCIKSEHSIS